MEVNNDVPLLKEGILTRKFSFFRIIPSLPEKYSR